MKKSNQTGGKNHKKYKKNSGVEEQKERLPKLGNNTQVYAIVKKKQGGSRLSVLCSDTIVRSAIIPGKMQKRVWINENDVILCDLNMGANDLCYIVHKYTAKEASKLKDMGLIAFEEVGSYFEQVEEEKKEHANMYPPSESEESYEAKPINYNHINDESMEDSSESIDLHKL